MNGLRPNTCTMWQAVVRLLMMLALSMWFAASAAAQEPPEAPPPPQESPTHDHAAMMAAAGARWQFSWDGALFATFNHQGGTRGESDFRSQNWLMVMGGRQLGPGRLGLSGMVSMEPVTVGAAGYSHVFQLGEAYRNLPVVDRQHPHDLFMQLEAGWRVPIRKAELSISGGPVGAPAFGPVAFMHRPSASENPVAPLTHHTFDSTHIAMGTVTAGARYGAFELQASAFHGREPDEFRYDLDTGALDSGSARVTWRPGGGLEAQVSRAYIHEPELLEPGNQKRINGSISWLRPRDNGAFTAMTIMAGRVTRTYTWSGAMLVEGIHWMGRQAVYARYEGLAVESEHLMFPQLVHPPHPGEFVDTLHTITIGGVRKIAVGYGIDWAIGGDVAFYRVPERLTSTHGERPASVHVFLRIRPARGGAPAQHHH